ncbi:MAG: type II secretion system F family protein [Alphaproteobacteria bacterium]
MPINLSDPLILTILISVLVGTAVLVAAFAVFGKGLSDSERMQRRLEGLAAPKTTDGPLKGPQSRARDREKDRRKAVEESLKELEQKQKEQRAKLTLRRRLEQAGLSISPLVFHVASAVFGITAALVAFVFGMKPWVAALIFFATGLGLPRWVLGLIRAKRMKKFGEEFANAIDVIVRGVKSGLPLNDCLQIISRESQEPVKTEFQGLVDAQKMGVPLEQSLQRMYDNMPTPEVSFFGIVLAIQQKTGGNLSEALGNLSGVLRGRKSMRGKIEALSGEAKASAMIIGALPPGVMLMVYLSTPAYISLLWTTHIGEFMIMGCVVWMSIGILIMRKMINFNF